MGFRARKRQIPQPEKGSLRGRSARNRSDEGVQVSPELFERYKKAVPKSQAQREERAAEAAVIAGYLQGENNLDWKTKQKMAKRVNDLANGWDFDA